MTTPNTTELTEVLRHLVDEIHKALDVLEVSAASTADGYWHTSLISFDAMSLKAFCQYNNFLRECLELGVTPHFVSTNTLAADEPVYICQLRNVVLTTQWLKAHEVDDTTYLVGGLKFYLSDTRTFVRSK